MLGKLNAAPCNLKTQVVEGPDLGAFSQVKTQALFRNVVIDVVNGLLPEFGNVAVLSGWSADVPVYEAETAIR